MNSRYSLSVVAPIMRSSPRASIGLSMLDAATDPSPPPAPISTCSSSMNVMTRPSDSVISLSTALSRSSNWPRYIAPATSAEMSRRDELLVLERLGDVARDDALGEPLDDGGLADAGLADEHGVVLGAAGQHLADPADLAVAPDHGVELALAGAVGEVDPELLEGALLRPPARAAAWRSCCLLKSVSAHAKLSRADSSLSETDAAAIAACAQPDGAAERTNGRRRGMHHATGSRN